ncbi:lytic transglycosylase domain-containing protein [Pandoraea pnomenusa]|uniref:lytic transglycosylase domain-containing protein n=1 Tax=Pandoraea pnomenusa TaxID=93220 RepID=UPI00242D386F|nr:lytic transglycosylase domain-containing protein [Pandoraea pnomenusa]
MKRGVALVLAALAAPVAPAALLPHHPRVEDAQLAVPTPPTAVAEPWRAPPPSAQAQAQARAERSPGPASAAPPFDALVRRTALVTDVDAALLHAIIDTESGYDPTAVSERGAIGLMQILPRTGQRFGVRRLEDPAENLRAGAAYVRWLLSRFDGDLRLVLAAYNAGEGAVLRHGRQVPPFAETRRFVQRVMDAYSRLQDAGASGEAVAPSSRKRVDAVGSAAPFVAGVPRDSVESSDPYDSVATVGAAGKDVAGKSSGAARPLPAGVQTASPVPAARTDGADASGAWRLLRDLGVLVTRSPSAEAERKRRRDRPAVMYERPVGATAQSAGRGG